MTLLLSLWLLLHPFYVSVTEIYYQAEEKYCQIAIKVFYDDTEEALANRFGKKIDLIETVETEATQKLLYDYLKAHFDLKINEKQLALTWVGAEREGDAIWCYLQSEKVRKVQSWEVNNRILLEEFRTQQNIIHFYLGSETFSGRTNRKQDYWRFDIDG